MNMPDLVANLRVDQAWGSAQIMGALHQVNTTYYGGDETTGHPDDKFGFAVGAGLKLNAPMIGAKDYFEIQATYTKGASRYSNNTANSYDYSKYDGTSYGFGMQSDAVFGGTVVGGTASNLELTTTWALNAAFTHNWTPALKSTLWASYQETNYNTAANNMLCSSAAVGDGNGLAGTAAVANAGCDMDWGLWGVGLRTEWKATKNLSMGVEVLYSQLSSASTSTGTIVAGTGTKPAGTYTLDDQEQLALRLRITRAFYP
jgi:hypothetical protein